MMSGAWDKRQPPEYAIWHAYPVDAHNLTMREKRAFVSADNRSRMIGGTLIPSSRCPFAPKTAANKSPKGFAQSALRPAEESRDRVAPWASTG